jgi:hypothetical protein
VAADIDALTGRLFRAYADARRVITRSGSTASVPDAFGTRPSAEGWIARSVEQFERYRTTHEPAASSIAVVCVSRRPDALARVVQNVSRQIDVDVELVLVLNHDGFDADMVTAAVNPLPSVRVLSFPESVTLGTCLNSGLDATDARFVAKFDDDDDYGAHYLVDALRAHAFAGAGVVGKHTYFAEFDTTGERYLRFPGNEFRLSGTLAGGTLVIDRRRTGDLRFDDISLGEDRRFLRGCHRRGISTFSADRFNFVQHRGSGNTWVVADDEFLAVCTRVEPGSRIATVEP